MTIPNLEALYLTFEELAAAKQEIKKAAFQKWQDAGCPKACNRDFWTEAHVEWVENCYEPNPSAFVLEEVAA